MKELVVGYYILLAVFTTYILCMAFVTPHGGVIFEEPVLIMIDIDVNTDILPKVLENAEVLGYYENNNTSIITLRNL